MLITSEKVPGDMVGVPTMERTDDNLVIDLYEDEDSEFGKVVGLKLTSCQFFPQRKGTPRKKQSENPTGAGTDGQPAPGSGEQASGK